MSYAEESIPGRGIAFAGPPTPTPSPTPTATSTVTPSPTIDPKDRALLAVVVLGVPKERTDGFSIGSGSIVSPEGYTLTNFHVVGDVDTGKLYNADGLALVGVNSHGPNQPPEIKYMAELMKADEELDLALLKISALKRGDPLPGDFSLTSVAIGDSDEVRIGDPITVIGFPKLGGATVTLTKGTVSGFHEKGPVSGPGSRPTRRSTVGTPVGWPSTSNGN